MSLPYTALAVSAYGLPSAKVRTDGQAYIPKNSGPSATVIAEPPVGTGDTPIEWGGHGFGPVDTTPTPTPTPPSWGGHGFGPVDTTPTPPSWGGHGFGPVDDNPVTPPDGPPPANPAPPSTDIVGPMVMFGGVNFEKGVDVPFTYTNVSGIPITEPLTVFVASDSSFSSMLSTIKTTNGKGTIPAQYIGNVGQYYVKSCYTGLTQLNGKQVASLDSPTSGFSVTEKTTGVVEVPAIVKDVPSWLWVVVGIVLILWVLK